MNTLTIETKRSAMRAKHPDANWHQKWTTFAIMESEASQRFLTQYLNSKDAAWDSAYSRLTPEEKSLAVVCPKCKPIANWLNGQIGFKCWEGKICPERIRRILEMEREDEIYSAPFSTPQELEQVVDRAAKKLTETQSDSGLERLLVTRDWAKRFDDSNTSDINRRIRAADANGYERRKREKGE